MKSLEVNVVSSWKRILIAAFISLLGCTITYWWHLKNEPISLSDSESDVIAYITSTHHEIHRKGVNNTLWELAEENDRLRAGDSVRTSSNSELRIQFYNSNRYIDLESDSMIVIQKQESEINLELLQGSLFVNGIDKNNKNSLTVKSQGGKIDLSKSSSQISGSSKEKIDLKVLKGTAQYLKTGAKSETIHEGKEGGIGSSGLHVHSESVTIINPDYTKPIYINATNPTPTTIEWKGFPHQAQIQLYSGLNRNNLLPVSTKKLSSNSLQVLWKPGIYYWKIIALETETIKSLGESSIFKSEVIGRFPPTAVAPEPNFIIQTRKPSENITLHWNTPPDVKEVLVELQNDKTKQQILKKRFPASQDFNDIPNLPLGSYSWKLTSIAKDNNQELVGPTHQFFINEKRLINIPVVWSSLIQENQYFVNSDPKIILAWEPDTSDRVKKWKIHITPEGLNSTEEKVFETHLVKIENIIPKPGRYLAYIEAFDEEGENIGKSENRTFNIASLPLLGAPKFLKNTGKEFLARPDGTFNLNWETLEGAQKYQIIVRTIDGKVISDSYSESPNFEFSNLMPGNYNIQLNAIDRYNRKSDLSEKRVLLVPNQSEVKAPKLKTIKVN